MEVLVIEKSPMRMSAFRFDGDDMKLKEWLEGLNLEGVSVADYLDIPEGHWLVDESPFGGVEHYTPRDFEELYVVVGGA